MLQPRTQWDDGGKNRWIVNLFMALLNFFTFFPLCKLEGNVFLRSFALHPGCLASIFFQSLWSVCLFCQNQGNTDWFPDDYTGWKCTILMGAFHYEHSHNLAKGMVGAGRRRSLPIICFTSKFNAQKQVC